MPKKKFRFTFWTLLGLCAFFVSTSVVVLPYFEEVEYEAEASDALKAEAQALSAAETLATTTEKFVATHVEAPRAIKAIYMTSCVSTVPSWRIKLKEEIMRTELNAVVLDIKDSTGTITFIDNELQPTAGSGCRSRDMKEFIAELHKENIYVIGRVAVFQDSLMTKLHPEWAVKSKATGAVWKDRKGLSFVDVGAKPYWDYVIDIAETSYELGFDEINFDYIRYPTDGNMKDADYTWSTASSTKAEMVKSFFVYLHDHLKDSDMKTSADLFGLVTVAEDDLGIGQVLTYALPYFDYIDPMVYPSHFAPGSNGISKPAENPYAIIHYSMLEAVKREAKQRVEMGISTSTPSKLRPWIQDFDLGADYDKEKVRAQIKATYDVGLTSWLSWDASNKYTPDAYLTE